MSYAVHQSSYAHISPWNLCENVPTNSVIKYLSPCLSNEYSTAKGRNTNQFETEQSN